jgi:putative oxidoreductase
MQRIFPTFLGGSAAVGLLVLRIVAGSAMMLHGWTKIQNPTAWMGSEAPVPGFLQALAALAEFGGGICWIVGVLTPVASFPIASTMATAAGMVHISQGHPFVGQPGSPSYEPAAGYLAIAILFLLAGPGCLSLDAFLFRKQTETAAR